MGCGPYSGVLEEPPRGAGKFMDERDFETLADGVLADLQEQIEEAAGDALDADLPLAEGLTKADLLKAIEGHIIGQGSLVAIYERKPKQRPSRGLRPF